MISDIENYEIVPEDIFNDYIPEYTTILNTEIAAIKRCTELLKKQQIFTDTEFGPETAKGGAY